MKSHTIFRVLFESVPYIKNMQNNMEALYILVEYYMCALLLPSVFSVKKAVHDFYCPITSYKRLISWILLKT